MSDKTRDAWVILAAIGLIFLLGGLGSGLASWYLRNGQLVLLGGLSAFLWLEWIAKVTWLAAGFCSGGYILGGHLKVASPFRVLFWVAVYSVTASLLLAFRSGNLFSSTGRPLWPIVLVQAPLGGVLCVLAGLLGAHVGRKLRNRAEVRSVCSDRGDSGSRRSGNTHR